MSYSYMDKKRRGVPFYETACPKIHARDKMDIIELLRWYYATQPVAQEYDNVS